MRTIKCNIAREQIREYDIIIWKNEMLRRSISIDYQGKIYKISVVVKVLMIKQRDNA